MAGRYDAFLVRQWSLDGGTERVEVTHVQSGARILVASLAEATTWIRGHAVAVRESAALKELPSRSSPD